MWNSRARVAMDDTSWATSSLSWSSGPNPAQLGQPLEIRLLAALGEDSRELSDLGAGPGGQSVERLPPLFPKVEAPA